MTQGALNTEKETEKSLRGRDPSAKGECLRASLSAREWPGVPLRARFLRFALSAHSSPQTLDSQTLSRSRFRLLRENGGIKGIPRFASGLSFGVLGSNRRESRGPRYFAPLLWTRPHYW